MPSRTRRTLIAGAIALPLAAGAAIAARRMPHSSAERQALLRFEARFEAALRALASSPSVADALSRLDAKALESALIPVRVAHQVDLVDVIGADSKIVTALRSDRFGIRARDMVDSTAGTWAIAARALQAAAPTPDPTSATIVKTSWGDAIYRAMPVTHNGRLVGAILVGTPLEDALRP